MIDINHKEAISIEIKRLEKLENKTEKENLLLRNLKRILDLEQNKPVYCPMINENITNLMKCMFCQFGHMTECHYPHECDSEYCNHPKEEED